MAVLDQVKSATTTITTYWKEQPPKRKKLVVAGGILVLVVAIFITVALNISAGSYEVLFPSITASESAEVYAVLQSKGADVKRNSTGQVLIPKDEYGAWMLSMIDAGYPKTSSPYSITLDNIGPTTTESEKQSIGIFQLQESIAETLKAIDGVKSAKVTISLPKTTDRVWEVDRSPATAAVLLTLETPGGIEAARVTTIKKLVAASIPQGKPENVVVTDAATSIDLDGATTGSGTTYDLKRLEYEKKYQKKYEDDVKRLLTSTYGAEGVVAVASLEFDYDTMKQESKEYFSEDGKNAIGSDEERYTANGGLPAGGIAGEENNTDIPDYVADDGATTDNITDFERFRNFQNSYTLTLLERGEAPIKKATISVLVNEQNLDANRREVLVDLISKAVGIDPGFISVSTLSLQDITPPVVPAVVPWYENTPLLFGLGGAMLLVLLIAILIPLMFSRGRKRKEAVAVEQMMTEQANAVNMAEVAQAEIEQRKSKLRNEAEAQKIQDGSMTEEIRNFAKENPEMTAVLIRSLLREDG